MKSEKLRNRLAINYLKTIKPIFQQFSLWDFSLRRSYKISVISNI